jgi:flagellar hook-associated protein 3 FlgL
MISSLTPSDQQFINNLGAISQRLSTDELQISSGVRMNQVSDYPDQISQLLEARASLSTSQQISANLGNVTTEVNGGEQALETTVSLWDQVQTLGAEGVTGTTTAATRQQLVQQLQSIEQEMVGLANTSVSGRYIFSGDSDQTQPYTYDPTQTPPLSAYQGTASTRVAQHPDGSTFPIALTAQQIFDSSDPTTNAFNALNTLITDFQNNDTTAIQTDNEGLAGIGDYLNQQLAFYGTTQDTITSATSYAQTQQTQLQAQISNLQDADVATAITDMTEATTQEQAALESQGRLPRETLFDYLG